MIEKKIITNLNKILNPNSILTGKDLKQRFHHIWKMNEPLEAIALLLPKNTNEVSKIMQFCYENNQELVIHGGLTNLVGGTETKKKQLVLSLEKMNTILELDEKSRTITSQSGVIIEDLINTASEKNLLLPLNFGAKGSAQIGGAISTNAGGLRVFKFGMIRHMVLGLEVVLPNGTIISSMKKILKDNSGYDLKQLFIGSEGTLGIVTKVILRLHEKPSSRTSAIAGINKYSNVIKLLKYLEKELSGALSGFEIMWKNTYNMMTLEPSILKAPIPKNYKYYIFIETLGSNHQNDYNLLEKLIENALEKNIIEDASMASNDRELNNLWQIREDVSVLDSNSNNSQHFDISIPIPKIGDIIDSICVELNKLQFVEKIFIFGHVADGNIHFIIGKNNNSIESIEKINKIVYSPLKENNGSVSAEHGIGLHKKKYLKTSRNKEEIELMKKIKKLFDPKMILNPKRII